MNTTHAFTSFYPLPLLAALTLAPACNRASAGERRAHAESAIAVSTVEVATRDVVQTQALTGTLTPNRKSDVAADATGKVAAILVERGTLLPSGAAIVRLDRRSASLAEEEASAQAGAARAQQALAERECGRADKLWAEGAINGAEHDRALAQCTAARLQATAASARARMAGKNLGDAVVRAPFRGLVAERYVSEGEYVRPDTRVATLVEIDPLRLELSVPEAAVPVLQKAAEVAFQVAAFPGETFHGKIRYVGPAVRRQSRDLLVEAVIANADRRLLPGMFATAQLVVGASAQPVIPESAIQRGSESDRVFVVVADRVRSQPALGTNAGPAPAPSCLRPSPSPGAQPRERVWGPSEGPHLGRLEERLVALGPGGSDGVAVLSGLRAGEHVVAPVTSDLRDGARVHLR
jgi:membrane fusion protein (multidrug efflux system)